MTLIDLLRHGEPIGGRKYRGQIDDALSEKGWCQMWDSLGEHKPWQSIVSSPLQRCLAFAEAVAQRYNLPLRVDDRFKEVGFGAWEGKTADELRRQDPDIINRFKQNPVLHRPPGAEALNEFAARVAAGWDALLSLHAGQHVLLVCHAGVIRMLLAQALGIPAENMYRVEVPSAGLSRIRIPDGEGAVPQLLFHHGRL